MGDVLAILRQAKTVHAQETRKKEATLVKSSPLQKSVVPPLKRLSGSAGSKVESVKPKPRLPEEKPPVTSWLKPDVQLTVSAKRREKTGTAGLTRKVIAPVGISSIDTRAVKRRADDAGSYTVKMPQGTTTKTRQVLQLQSEKASKPGIFSRLGVSTSSSPHQSAAAQSSIFRRLGTSSSSARRIVERPAGTGIGSGGVQSRLGSASANANLIGTRFLRQDETESSSSSSVFDRLGTT